MNTAEFVAALIKQQKEEGIDPQQIVWNAALACVGWPYVFGARGDWCDPQNRRARYRDDHPTIKTACRNFDGLSGCTGCKWYPGGKRVRCFDCRGFTYYWLKQVYGWTLHGAGATSQWNTASNWKAKGPISTIPEDTLVCLFVQKGKTMEHTGFGFRGQTVECSVNVQHFDKRNRKWTHWAVPMCIDQEPSPTPITKPTLRQGDSGPYVAEMQQELIACGYDVGTTGADGKFGKNTRSALIAFQTNKGLTADGVCGPKTWEELDRDPTGTLYTVHIPHLTKGKAEEIVTAYAGGAYMTPDEGR